MITIYNKRLGIAPPDMEILDMNIADYSWFNAKPTVVFCIRLYNDAITEINMASSNVFELIIDDIRYQYEDILENPDFFRNAIEKEKIGKLLEKL